MPADRNQLIATLKRLGQAARNMGNLHEALRLYEEAAGLCEQEGDNQLLAHTIRHVGDIYFALEQRDLAEPNYLRALTLYRTDASSSPLDLANALRPYALLKEACGEAGLAQAMWQEAMSLYKIAEIPAGVQECAEHLRSPTH